MDFPSKSFRSAIFTNDVEDTSIWFNSLRDETAKKVMDEGMPLLLELYAKHNIVTTFFFTGYVARLYPNIVRMVLPYGHEVGSHGKSHLKENGFDIMPYDRQKRHLEESKKLLEDISGQEVVTFRAPALRVNRDTPRALIETGFRIDSSVASQRFDFFLSFGGFKKLNWFFAPRLPYRVAHDSMFRKGDSPLIEVPLSALFFPYVGTTMRMFPFLTAIQRSGIHLESSINYKPVVFDIHPNEFIDESQEPRIIERRAKNYVTYLLKDLVRSKLKSKNLGPQAARLYESEIEYFKSREYKFMTLRQYVETVQDKL